MTITPPLPQAIMVSSAAEQPCQVPVRFTATRRCQSSTVADRVGTVRTRPAALIHTASPFPFAAALPARAKTAARSVTSTSTAVTPSTVHGRTSAAKT